MSALPNRDRRAERREATRREILDAAWEIARRDGLSAVTLREVAASIGMRSPSLYSHFDSKNAIYDAMFGQAWTQYSEALAEVELTLPRSAGNTYSSSSKLGNARSAVIASWASGSRFGRPFLDRAM